MKFYTQLSDENGINFLAIKNNKVVKKTSFIYNAERMLKKYTIDELQGFDDKLFETTTFDKGLSLITEVSKEYVLELVKFCKEIEMIERIESNVIFPEKRENRFGSKTYVQKEVSELSHYNNICRKLNINN